MQGLALRDHHSELLAKNVVVLGVSFDSPADNLAFQAKHDFPYRLLSDADRAAALAYGAAESEDDGYAKRVSALIDEEGQLVHFFPDVDPRNHLDDVLKVLSGL